MKNPRKRKNCTSKTLLSSECAKHQDIMRQMLRKIFEEELAETEEQPQQVFLIGQRENQYNYSIPSFLLKKEVRCSNSSENLFLLDFWNY